MHFPVLDNSFLLISEHTNKQKISNNF